MVRRVNERLEIDDDGIRQLAAARMMPGCEATVVENVDGSVTLDTETGVSTRCPRRVAENLYVSTYPEPRSAPELTAGDAGMMLTTVPSVSGVSTPCMKRMSSSATNTLTKRRSSPLSSKRRSAKPACCASSAFNASLTVAASTETSDAPPARRAQLRGDADRDCHGRQASSMSNAAWNASRLGAIVAVGPLVGATASIVFSP